MSARAYFGVRFFRDLVYRTPVLEIGRLRIWIDRAMPSRPYFSRTRWGTTLCGAWIFRAMWFNHRRRAARSVSTGERDE